MAIISGFADSMYIEKKLVEKKFFIHHYITKIVVGVGPVNFKGFNTEVMKLAFFSQLTHTLRWTLRRRGGADMDIRLL